MAPSVRLQLALPRALQRVLSRLVYMATRATWKPWKDFLIRQISRRFDVDLSEAAEPDPSSYPHFNAFFTRALKAGARPLDTDPQALLCPADGRISQSGAIEAGRIFQAKGQSFSAAELLGDEQAALPYADGAFITVYLSPRDYHRVHMPLAGTLVSTVHIPGRLFSVAPHAVEGIPGLFALNERLVCHFQGDSGPFVLVMVGALLVSGVSTVWSGVEIPPYATRVGNKNYEGRGLHLARGAEMGRFNMGSTVIVLVPSGAARIEAGLRAEQPVKVGQRIGSLLAASPAGS
jgi:phosphatidylserine decarboxylase